MKTTVQGHIPCTVFVLLELFFPPHFQKGSLAMKFFDPAIFQKCWWGQGAKPLVAAAAAKHPVPYSGAGRGW
ncbi:MAG: hypothetical protein ACI4XB_04150 [Ruminococcus sp.]